MLDFVEESVLLLKNGTKVISPDFVTYRPDGKPVEDLMVRGGEFYAVWDEEAGMWSTDSVTAKRLIDKQLDIYAKKYRDIGETVSVMHLRNAKTRQVDEFNKYCKSQLSENFHQLDTELTFIDDKPKKKDYASKRLGYSLAKGSTENWDCLVDVLYEPEEKLKIEWTIGCIVAGDSKKVQKFVVMCGDRGTGKSTILKIIEKLFDGYCATINAGNIGSSTNAFSLEAVRDNPLVAIEHESKLNKIDDNTKLNALVSHESLLVNVKNKSQYASRFNTFLILASNNPVKITDAKSGILRRLIDISPTGNKVKRSEYDRLVAAIDFELGAIAYKCLDIYKRNKHMYDDYVPIRMFSATNDFYTFMNDRYYEFLENDPIPLSLAYKWYDEWSKASGMQFKANRHTFGEELKNYYREFFDRKTYKDGTRVRNLYSGFKTEKFEESEPAEYEESGLPEWLDLKSQPSKLDILWAEYPAQYSNGEGKPTLPWDRVKNVLSDLNTSLQHYVKPSPQHIMIDFDLVDDNGEKSLEKNLQAALIFPPTYAETSKSGKGLHLHYFYTGNVEELANLYSAGIEIKKFTGGSSCRRKVKLCNNLDITPISAGLPLKERKQMVNFEGFKSEKGLRRMIERNLRKEISPYTKPSIDFIFNDLETAFNSGFDYDVSDMRNAVCAFAASSSHQAEACLKTVSKMKFKSNQKDNAIEFHKFVVSPSPYADDRIFIFDCEVAKNVFIICYAIVDKNITLQDVPTIPVVKMIQPAPADVEDLFDYKLVGFYCKNYDNHILWARSMGYDNTALYNLSASLTSDDKEISRKAKFGEARNVSFTDIYEVCSKKQGLKKWENDMQRGIKIGDEIVHIDIPHSEWYIPWDQPVPEELWDEFAEYCANDVRATVGVWLINQPDFKAREILADIAGMTVNESTNALTTKFIFGNERNPQEEFEYRDMAKRDGSLVVPSLDCDWEYTVFNKNGKPVYPDYKFEYDSERHCYISTYRGEEIGEGGYVYSEPGMYKNVVTFDVASMHPSSIIAENLFGDTYTKRFNDILQLRIAIKHKDFEKAKTLLNGAAAKYLDDEKSAKALSQALKIAINSVYGLTSAKFDNPFRDSRNVDNIVAKRGALFMVNLKHEVQNQGFKVIHIKTDSIKVVDPTPELEQFIMEYGKLYGYSFEIEDKYERICLVNDAVYIARHHDGTWTATGKQFAVPYVKKTLFDNEPIEFYDMCETFSVTSSLWLDMNELLPDVSAAEAALKKAKKDGDTAAIDILREEIAKGHNYKFVGRTGMFTPVDHGGLLMRKAGDDEYSYASGTKGYRWLESEFAKPSIEDGTVKIDISYYENLVEAAKETISKYGNFDDFVNV